VVCKQILAEAHMAPQVGVRRRARQADGEREKKQAADECLRGHRWGTSVWNGGGSSQLRLEFGATPDGALVHRLPSDGRQSQVFVCFAQRRDLPLQLRVVGEHDYWFHGSHYRPFFTATTGRARCVRAG